MERTDELNARNEQIALQNRKLSETISLKNKIFSVISHDLRSPVVNILYTLYMLKEEEFRDKTESLADSCIQYSQQLISLLENMLVWGKGQEDMIRYVPAEHDLADIVLTNISILKDGADRKNISLILHRWGDPKGGLTATLWILSSEPALQRHQIHASRGKVTISVREKEETADWVTIKICDTGVGISRRG
ncbi:MAG: hypothetical protein R2756_04625 [Bacteroidales bacterium]